MAHLSIEKALKGIYQKKLGKEPPRTHNLIYLIKECNLKLGEEYSKFIVKINQASILTRYPEELSKIEMFYSKETSKIYLEKTKEVLNWIKKELSI